MMMALMTSRRLVLAVAVFALLPVAARGQVDPPPAEQEAVDIHVSSSTGVDGQDGRTPETAVATIRRGQALMRDERGDRLLLKRGDTFNESFGNWNKSGHSPERPLVIGAYGEGPRPKVVTGQGVFNIYRSPLLHDVTIAGIHFIAANRDPDAPDYDPKAPGGNAIRIVQPVHRFTIDDCRFDFFNGALILTGDPRKGRPQEVTVRRCLVLDSYSTAGAHSGQGLYADKIDGLTIEGCVFDHNGWNEKIPEAIPNIFRHNIYISHDTTGVRVRGNVIARGASHGIQMRSGGICEGNLFVDNAIHAFLGGEEAVFRNNVVIGGRDIDQKTPRGFGVTVAAGRSVVEDNLLVHKVNTSGGAIGVEQGKWSPATGVGAEIRNNVIYNWSGNGLEVTAAANEIVFENNDVRILGKGRKVVTIKRPLGKASFADNRYYADEPRRERWFSAPEGFMAPDAWGQAMRDTSRIEQARYPGADKTLAADFLTGAREQKDGHDAGAAIAMMRGLFGRGPATAGSSPRQNASASRERVSAGSPSEPTSAGTHAPAAFR